jgi:2-oxoglutarate ferredoxin oxidoreductase subunit gamma
MTTRYEIRLAGSGGQGLILAGIILAEAAGIYDGKFVCRHQSYGPEARGGASKSEIVISDEEIDYPKAINPDVFLAMNQKSLDTYISDLKLEGMLIIDSSLVREVPSTQAVAIPLTQIARQELGKMIVVNIVALGALVALTEVVTFTSLEARGFKPGASCHQGVEPKSPRGRGCSSEAIFIRKERNTFISQFGGVMMLEAEGIQ